MKKALFIILFASSFAAFSQSKQQISIGYGFNNVYADDFQPLTGIVNRGFIGAVNYHYIFANKFEVRGAIAYADYQAETYINSPEILFSKTDVSIISLNVGTMYHYFVNKNLDISSGFSLGGQNRRTDNDIQGLGNRQKFVYAINLLNVKYFPFNEHIGIYGELILDNAYHSNYWLGLVYQF